MKITNGKDLWAGLMFLGLGLGFLIASKNYNMGSAVRMGPAYFPTLLGGMLAVLGGMVLLRAFISKVAHPVKVFPFRTWVFVAFLAVSAIAYWGAATITAIHPVLHQAFVAVALVLFFATWGPRSLAIIMLITVVYGYALKPLGMVIATLLLIFGSAAGGREFKFKEVTYLFIVLALFSVFGFIKGLGLPFNIWPEWN